MADSGMIVKRKARTLLKAKKAKNDEFYTQWDDIEKEMKHYLHLFEGKVVLCNCDDPRQSNFFKYFSVKFRKLGLKRLIATCYKNDSRDLFSKNVSEKSIYLIYDGEEDENRMPDIKEINIRNLEGNGDFMSAECIELLKQADIVVTNPPFSLFRKYIAQLIEYDKKFLIIGNMNAMTYKETFRLIRDNKMWIGTKQMGQDMLFDVPKEYAKVLVETKKEGSGYKIIDGVVKGRASGIWLTNLEHEKRKEWFETYKEYNPDKYPVYENYDAINVDKVADIPEVYDGEMGVPITFMDSYNPEQFEILALGIVGSIDFTKNRKMEILDKNGNPTGKYTMNAKGTLYKIYEPDRDKKPPAFKDAETGQLYSSIYARIIIKRKPKG